jgi:hypothetical protein
MTLLSLLLLTFVLWTSFSLRPELKGLTAASALSWALLACCVMIGAITVRFSERVPVGYVSCLHYLGATLMLTPLVDILGARKPGHRVWPWFVVCPMILVLQWPVVSHLMSEQATTHFDLPIPTLMGFLLVLIMGAGNYFGTANTATCLIGAAGIILFVLPLSNWSNWPGDGMVLAGSVCLTLSVLLAEGRLKSSGSSVGHERLWLDFRDTYGLVWARRVMDRINQFADREKWNVVMTLDGFRPTSDAAADDGTHQRPVEVLRWVLRRFASETFLNRYLMQTDSLAETEESPAD